MLKAVNLIPNATRLVAYHTEEKAAIGFLYLEENTFELYTIEYVFVDPRYRKMGVANRLLDYAMVLAKEKGASRVNLSVDANSSRVIELYTKLGFEKIGHVLLVQGYLPGSAHSRLVKRYIMGQGCLTKLAQQRRGQLFKVKKSSRKNREALFNIYKRCMNQRWVDFFEINASNLINGSRHVWQPPFFRDVLVNGLVNSFALIFSRPFSSKATVELYSTSDAAIPSLLEDLLNILTARGIAFTQITLFNHSDTLTPNWFEEKRMKTFKFAVMGRAL
jgi:predicted GNAT family acetyltransferase